MLPPTLVYKKRAGTQGQPSLEEAAEGSGGQRGSRDKENHVLDATQPLRRQLVVRQMTKLEPTPIGPGRSAVLVALLVALSVLACAGAATAAPPPLLSEFCDTGSAAGQCTIPSSVATDPANGNVYVAAPEDKRINEFTIWGQFVKAFGGGVVNGGATGMGTLSPGSTTVSAASTTTKAFVPGMAIEGAGISPGSTIAKVDNHALILSKPATSAATSAPTALSSPEAPGNVPTNELQRIAVTATGGAFSLEFALFAPDGGEETTTDLPYNASAAQVQSALEALASIGSGDVAVSSGNPGGEAGVPGGPYTVEFKGARFADTNVPGLIVRAGTPALSGGSATVEPVRQGASAPEVCTGLDCRQGVDGIRAGQFAVPRAVAVDSNSDLYVYESANCTGGSECEETFRYSGHGANRVQKFDSNGNFLLMFGGGVNEGGGTPSSPGNICTAQDIANGDVCGGGKLGSGDSEFGGGPLASLDPEGSFIATGPGGTVYVGGQEHVQEFEANGTFLKSISIPGEIVQSLAVDAAGNLYLTFFQAPVPGLPENPGSKKNVIKLSPAGATIATLPVQVPKALAIDAAGNVYVVDGPKTDGGNVELRKFSPAGAEVPSFTFEDGFTRSIGIATGSACGVAGTNLFIANYNNLNSYVRAYGPPPNPTICPPGEVAPTITSQYAASVGSNGATLRAQINPHFWPDATYYVQYGTGKCSEGGCDQEKPLSPGSKLTTAVTSQDLTTAGVFLAGLVPSTTYHYRFVAQSSGGGPVRGVGGEVGQDGAEATFNTFPATIEAKQDCPNQEFRTSASATLPDCRAYEMVSPVDKNGGDVAAGKLNEFEVLAQSSADGQRATFSSIRPFGSPEAAPLISQYLAVRGSDGWSTHPISPPRKNTSFFAPISDSGQYKMFSEDLCSGWLLQETDLPLAPEAPPGVPSTYRLDNCGEGSYELLTSVAPPGFGAGGIPAGYYVPLFQGASADETHAIFRADAKLTSNACSTAGIYQVYETSKEGPLRLISVLPNGQATCTGSSPGTMGGTVDNLRDASVQHAISADGSRVFWTDTGSPQLATNAGFAVGAGKLYVRVNATQAQSKIAAGKCTEVEKACTLAVSESDHARYWGADTEGTTAIYTAEDELFKFNVDEAKSQLIAKGVSGVVGSSEDASRVYFISTEALSGGQENSEGDRPQVGKSNLYLAEGGAITFIATVANPSQQRELPENAAFTPSTRNSRVSPDGLHLAFGSTESITGYDNVDLASSEADAEIFLYDVDSNGGPGQLACVSCNPSGARPRGREMYNGDGLFVGGKGWTAALIAGWTEHFRPTRLLSADGSRLFFNSVDALVPGDTNGKQDVYEWQRSGGPGGCAEAGAELFVPAAGGCLSLISSGQGGEDSEIIDASDGGRDALIATSSSLLPQDPGLVDIYDARVGGGYPPAPNPQPSCEGEACQGPLAPPNDPTPGSSSFEGAGNVVEKPAKKKAHKKKHAKKKANHHKKAHKRADHKRRAGR